METLTREATAREFRRDLAACVNEVAYGDGRVGVARYGQLVAVLIGMDDFRRLRRLEDEREDREIVETDDIGELDEVEDAERLQQERDLAELSALLTGRPVRGVPEYPRGV